MVREPTRNDARVLIFVALALLAGIAYWQLTNIWHMQAMRAEAGATAHAAAVEEFLDDRLLIARSLNGVFVPPPLTEPQQFTSFAARAIKVLPYATAPG